MAWPWYTNFSAGVLVSLALINLVLINLVLINLALIMPGKLRHTLL